MRRIRIVNFPSPASADVFKVNKSGQTALMRSVMFANNYDVRKFPELYELLHRSMLNIDKYNRTVFHHIVDVAMSKGKTHARWYKVSTQIPVVHLRSRSLPFARFSFLSFSPSSPDFSVANTHCHAADIH
jgi:hypothetical protein